MRMNRTHRIPAALFGALAVAALVALVVPAASQRRTELPSRRDALAGRATPIETATEHFVFRSPLAGPFPARSERAIFGMGCFWGAERRFWTIDGVISTAAGYAGGLTPNATYEEVSSGRTGHAEVVRVVYDPARVRYEDLLRAFWEGHDPTQGMRQGADVGTQYRSAIYTTTAAQRRLAERSRELYQRALTEAGFDRITTEIASAGPFYFAEGYHQQYLAKNPDGYCGHGGLPVTCPIGLAAYPAEARR
jgi:peptide-methionine (S)-S-oxide reductase